MSGQCAKKKTPIGRGKTLTPALSLWIGREGRTVPAGVRGAGVVVAVGLALALSACSPQAARESADKVGQQIIQEKQTQALGRNEPLRVEPPADTLRRRLMIDQNLPRSSDASLNSTDVSAIKQWPDPEYLDKSHRPTTPPLVTAPATTTPTTLTAPTTVATTAPADSLATTQPATQPTTQPLKITLLEAMQIGANNAREYQTQKEQIYIAALRLDLERNAFRNIWSVIGDSTVSTDLNGSDTTGVDTTGALSLDRRLKNGMRLTAGVAMDMVQLLSGNRASSRGITADASISIPLLRGSSQFVVTEPLTQADRNVIYSIWQFERYKRQFAVRVASDYLGVLQNWDQMRNAEDNYKRVIASTRRSQRLAEAGRLPEIQLDQARQNELRARERWISSRESYKRRLDSFKLLLGLPPDAQVQLDRSALEQLLASGRTRRSDDNLSAETTPPATAPITLREPRAEDAGPYELDESRAVAIALENRLDLRVALGEITDAQRGVAVAADNLRADLDLLGRASAGEGRSLGGAGLPDGALRSDSARYSLNARVSLPMERTSERIQYRGQLIDFERSVRDLQALEDQVKLDIRNALRRLLESREGVAIQSRAVELAQRRVNSTSLFLEAGRAQIRDLLEAQDALVQAQNSLTNALVNYRIAELEIQRDMDVLRVDERGLWTEYKP